MNEETNEELTNQGDERTNEKTNEKVSERKKLGKSERVIETLAIHFQNKFDKFDSQWH